MNNTTSLIIPTSFCSGTYIPIYQPPTFIQANESSVYHSFAPFTPVLTKEQDEKKDREDRINKIVHHYIYNHKTDVYLKSIPKTQSSIDTTKLTKCNCDGIWD